MSDKPKVRADDIPDYLPPHLYGMYGLNPELDLAEQKAMLRESELLNPVPEEPQFKVAINLPAGATTSKVDINEIADSLVDDDERVDASRLAELRESGNTISSSFTKRQYPIFSTPLFSLSLQGISRLVSLDSMTIAEALEQAVYRRHNWKSFAAQPESVKAAQLELGRVLQANKAKLYHDGDWHREFVGRLVISGLPINASKVGNRPLVETTIARYLSQAKVYVSANFLNLEEAVNTYRHRTVAITMETMTQGINDLKIGC